MKVKVLKQCFLDGKRRKKGAVVEFDDHRARARLVATGYLEEAPEDAETAAGSELETAAGTVGGGRKTPED